MVVVGGVEGVENAQSVFQAPVCNGCNRAPQAIRQDEDASARLCPLYTGAAPSTPLSVRYPAGQGAHRAVRVGNNGAVA